MSPMSLGALTDRIHQGCSFTFGRVELPAFCSRPSSKDHPANKFADAFLTAQSVITKRSRLNEAWKLIEFWEDRIVEPMAVIGKVLDPIIENALKKKGEKEVSSAGDNLEGETLLSHLVNLTDGEHRFRLFSSSVSRPPRPQDYPRRDG
jgi:hypothetical protein